MKPNASHKPVSDIRSGLFYCTWEGGFANAYTVLVDVPYLIAFALALGAGNQLLALIGGLPYLARVFQLAGAYLVERTGNRKRLSLLTTALNREVWLIPAVAALLITDQTLLLTVFTLTVLVSHFSGNMLGTVWMSWISDLIPPSLRARYFGFRNSLMAAVSVALTFGIGALLDFFKDSFGSAVYGFAVMFVFAAAAGAVTMWFFYKQYEPPFTPPPYQKGVAAFVEEVRQPLRDKNFRPILIFFCLWSAAIGICSVFFTVQMIDVLKMSFLQIALYQIIITAGRVLFNRVWGQIMSRTGAAAVLKLSASMIAVLPALWFFARPDFLLPIWIDAVLSGIAYGGFELAAMDVQISESQAKGRSYYFAWYGILSGLGYFLLSLVSGAIADSVKGEFISLTAYSTYTFGGYQWLFLASVLGRLLSLIVLIRLRPHADEDPAALALELAGDAGRRLNDAGRDAGRRLTLAGRRLNIIRRKLGSARRRAFKKFLP